MKGKERVIIENISPEINDGKYPVKRIVDDIFQVEADIVCDGHESLNAEILYRKTSESEWKRMAMEPLINDRWKGRFRLEQQEDYLYTIEAWTDHFRTWHKDILKRIDAGVDYSVDLEIGAGMIGEVLESSLVLSSPDREFLKKSREMLGRKSGKQEDRIESILSGELLSVMELYPLRKNASRYQHELRVMVERKRAGFSSWYEFFPRSVIPGSKEHGTFRDCINFLPYIKDMGFDVVYLPPIHPVGETNRKGPNNSTRSGPDDPGSPWAIGSKEGGHKSINPKLGTMDDFEELAGKIREHDMELALDIAFQCSPDHPYVKEHPEWFKKRPDGSIQYAENPPKKYEDIFPFDFESDDWEAMWHELKSVILFWIDKGVNIFRVDNPHTKSIHFWGWAITEIRREHPDVIFLSEAFTRPKLMYQLAKQGFTQSYTYFTWRNTKYELTEYMNILVNTEVNDFFRPNLWPNTPDILPEFLQLNGKPGYIIRLALAATLSSNYGIYGPAFELMDSTPRLPGTEEYLDSEKYEIKNWHLDNPSSLKKIIRLVNKIRKENPALRNNHSLQFHNIDNEQLICYSKHSEDKSNILLMVVNLDPHHRHSGWLHFPIDYFGIDEHSSYQMHDLISGTFYLWQGAFNYVELDPGIMPVHLFRVRKKLRTERDFDYFM